MNLEVGLKHGLEAGRGHGLDINLDLIGNVVIMCIITVDKSENK